MKIKLTTAEAIRLTRILSYSDVGLLGAEGKERASADLDGLNSVYDQLVDRLTDRRIALSDYGDDPITDIEEV